MNNFNIQNYNSQTINFVEKLLDTRTSREKLDADIKIFLSNKKNKITIIPTGVSGYAHKGYAAKQNNGKGKK